MVRRISIRIDIINIRLSLGSMINGLSLKNVHFQKALKSSILIDCLKEFLFSIEELLGLQLPKEGIKTPSLYIRPLRALVIYGDL